MVNFAIDTIGGHRLAAPATAHSGSRRRSRPTWAQPALHRPSVTRGQYLDQALRSILDTDCRRAKAVWGPKVH